MQHQEIPRARWKEDDMALSKLATYIAYDILSKCNNNHYNTAAAAVNKQSTAKKKAVLASSCSLVLSTVASSSSPLSPSSVSSLELFSSSFVHPIFIGVVPPGAPRTIKPRPNTQAGGGPSWGGGLKGAIRLTPVEARALKRDYLAKHVRLWKYCISYSSSG